MKVYTISYNGHISQEAYQEYKDAKDFIDNRIKHFIDSHKRMNQEYQIVSYDDFKTSLKDERGYHDYQIHELEVK